MKISSKEAASQWALLEALSEERKSGVSLAEGTGKGERRTAAVSLVAAVVTGKLDLAVAGAALALKSRRS